MLKLTPYKGDYTGASPVRSTILKSNSIYGPIAQRLEQGTHNPLVVGSNPTRPTIFHRLLQIKLEVRSDLRYSLYKIG